MLTFFSQLEQKTLAKIAYDHQLFMEGWSLKSYYEIILEISTEHPTPISAPHLILGFDGIIPVGAFALDLDTRQINIFIKEEYRKKGVGSELLHHALKKMKLSKNEVFGSSGLPGSKDFYYKNDIPFFQIITDEEIEDFLTLYEKKLIAEGTNFFLVIKDKIQKQYDKQIKEKL